MRGHEGKCEDAWMQGGKDESMQLCNTPGYSRMCVGHAGAMLKLSDKRWRLPASEYLYFPGNMQLITFWASCTIVSASFWPDPDPSPNPDAHPIAILRLGTISISIPLSGG